MAYIPADRMKKLREAARNGDERAKKILQAQLKGEDYSIDIEDYFKPAEEQDIPDMPATNPGSMPDNVSTGNPNLDRWLKMNNISPDDEDYEDSLEEYYGEYPNERPAMEHRPEHHMEETPANVDEEVDFTRDIAEGIIDLISKCDQTMLSIMQNEEIDETAQKGAMTSLQEIKQSLFDAADKIKKIKKSLCKDEENTLE